MHYIHRTARWPVVEFVILPGKQLSRLCIPSRLDSHTKGRHARDAEQTYCWRSLSTQPA